MNYNISRLITPRQLDEQVFKFFYSALETTFGFVDLNSPVPDFDQTRVNYSRWLMDLHEDFTRGEKAEDKPVFQIHLDFPDYKKVRKTAVYHDVMQRKPCKKKRRNSIAYMDKGVPQKRLEEKQTKRT